MIAVTLLSGCASRVGPAAVPKHVTSAPSVPRFAHIVILVLENHSYGEVIGNPATPYLNDLASDGAVLTQSYAMTHPSEPNYLALFSGSTHALRRDVCPVTFHGPNLATALRAAGRSFAGYAEQLPRVGYTGCTYRSYTRSCNPWMDYPAPAPDTGRPMSAFPRRFSELPSVSFVVPDLRHDMHSGTPAAADAWIRTHLAACATWSMTHNSILIVTTDEDDRHHDNRIPTFMVGAHVRPGRYAFRVDDYGVLATVLAADRVRPFGAAASARPITAVWTTRNVITAHGH